MPGVLALPEDRPQVVFVRGPTIQLKNLPVSGSDPGVL